MAILKYKDESGNFSPLSFIISVPGEDNPQQVYELPIASADVLGGVKIDNDTIVIDDNGVIKTTITLPTKVSELENDANYVTEEQMNSRTEINDDVIGDTSTWSSSKIASEMDKLSGLTFSISGTTLSITNGTNTWTLEANS